MSVSTTPRQILDRGDAGDLQPVAKPCHFTAKRQASLLHLEEILPREQTRDITSFYLSVTQDTALLRETFPAPIRSYDQRETLMPCKYRCGGCRFCSLYKKKCFSTISRVQSHIWYRSVNGIAPTKYGWPIRLQTYGSRT